MDQASPGGAEGVSAPRRRRAGLFRRGGSGPPRGPKWWRALSPRWRRAIRIGLGLFAAGCLVLGALVAYAAATLPSLDLLGQRTGSIRILDRNGALIASLGADDISRTTVPIDQISKTLQQATVATEDRNFYNEGAFNIGRVAKALFVDVIARRPEQGGSTITQQLAKQAFFVDASHAADRSVMRKLREALLANEIDQRFSKDEILDKYLNVIYYGEGAYGIENAAQTYFGVHAKDLDLRESALLAGLPQAPSYLDPRTNPGAAYARMHDVITSMVDVGDITADQAQAVDPTAADPGAAQANQAAIQADLGHGKRQAVTGDAPHFAQYIRDQVNQLFKNDPAFTSGTITVQTTLDLGIQRQAQASVTKGVSSLSGGKANNGALLMMDANTGDILAMVGSADFNNAAIGGQYNITTADRRPGSSFKPYVYEEGFKAGAFRPDTVLQDTRSESAKLGNVHDFDYPRFEGSVSASTALLHSRNVPTEQAMQMAGISNVIDFAHSMGLTTDLADNLTTAIGTSSVKMIEHTAAYGAFANGGRVYSPRAITSITDGNGNSLYSADTPQPTAQPMTPAQAYGITKILRGYAPYWGLRFNHDTAGKSGTTDNFVDAWYMTYTPGFVVATWAGNTSGDNPAEQPMDNVFGTDVGKAIAVPFLNGLPSRMFQPFVPVNGPLTDCTSSQGCPSPSASASPSPTPSPSPSPSASPSPSPSPTPLATPEITLPPVTPPPATPEPTPTPPPTPTPTPTPTASPPPGGG